uniref:Uncharacterized protein n=1 Tax=Rhipicephalus zambeziensis TaxID=60191 RepID=A0A224YT93_9ACAR
MVLSTASAQHIHPSAVCVCRALSSRTLCTSSNFFVLPSCSHDLILGSDFLSCHEAIIDCSRAQVSLVPTHRGCRHQLASGGFSLYYPFVYRST